MASLWHRRRLLPAYPAMPTSIKQLCLPRFSCTRLRCHGIMVQRLFSFKFKFAIFIFHVFFLLAYAAGCMFIRVVALLQLSLVRVL